MTNVNADWPTEIRLNSAKNQLRVTFSDGAALDLDAEYLRVFSPSAEVQGHAPDERKIVEGKKDVTITKLEQVGNYAIQIIFDDGHDTGLYTWLYLRDLGEKHDVLWKQYLEELEANDMSR
ncbi:MAG: DUF971 domain-containing protein [Alphaproteobacteria bacterium]